MKKLLIIAVIVVFGTVGVSYAQSVVGSEHDLSVSGGAAGSLRSNNITWVCAFCHTPHQAAAAAGQDPLWNHTLSTHASYGVYDSVTLNANPVELGSAAGGSASVSHLCLSCHDGSVGLGSLWNNPDGSTPSNSGTAITGTALMGQDLTDDHPINFTYDSNLAVEDGGLKTPVSSAWVDAAADVPLFASKVQCSSCHDPHDNTHGAFLVTSNASSALCLKCHNK